MVVHPPSSIGIKIVSAGDQSVWALDHHGKVWYRQEISPVFPEGTSWTSVPNVSSSPNAFTGGDVRAISASGTGDSSMKSFTHRLILIVLFFFRSVGRFG